MGEDAVVAADGMPLRVGDKVVGESGGALKVLSFARERAGGKIFVLCRKETLFEESVCCSVLLPEELVHAPSWWEGAE